MDCVEFSWIEYKIFSFLYFFLLIGRLIIFSNFTTIKKKKRKKFLFEICLEIFQNIQNPWFKQITWIFLHFRNHSHFYLKDKKKKLRFRKEIILFFNIELNFIFACLLMNRFLNLPSAFSPLIIYFVFLNYLSEIFCFWVK